MGDLNILFFKNIISGVLLQLECHYLWCVYVVKFIFLIGSLYDDSEHYFWYHHSPGDRVDVYDPDTLDKVGALWTAVSYVAADVSFRLPQQTKDP